MLEIFLQPKLDFLGAFFVSELGYHHIVTFEPLDRSWWNFQGIIISRKCNFSRNFEKKLVKVNFISPNFYQKSIISMRKHTQNFMMIRCERKLLFNRDARNDRHSRQCICELYFWHIYLAFIISLNNFDSFLDTQVAIPHEIIQLLLFSLFY